jgi:hypothetical protein
MKRLILLAASMALICLLQSSLTLADVSVNDTADVYVSVEKVAEVTVFPSILSWSVIPGGVGGTKLLDIKNTGSVNLTNIYAYVDTLTDETTRPYGSPNATDYAAGGLIVFKNETYNKFFFAGRIEWNWTEDISNMQKTGVNSPVAWGFFKNTTYEYNWLVGNGTGGFCNNTGAQFALEDDEDNGTAATRTPTTDGISYNGGDANFGYFSINRQTAPLYESCVAVSYDCQKIYIYRYDKRNGFSICQNSRYIQAHDLVPYETHTLTLDIYTPLGIPFGNLNTATITVVATGVGLS